MKDTPAIRLRFQQGKVLIYINEVLSLEAPWAGPKATIETDQRLKRWPDDLIKGSDESS